MGNAATRVLNGIGGAHLMFLGLSLVAYTLERYLTMKGNIPACKELLEELIELAKEMKKFKDAVPNEIEKVRKAILEIAVGAVICGDYIARGSASRYWTAGVMESQLQKTKQRIRDLRDSLTHTATIHTAHCVGHIAKRSKPCPSELLDFQPEGIEEQVVDVKKLLDIGGSEEAIAVVIVGFGGIGKSTLAASVIHSLSLPSTDFKFSMVTIDQKTPDRTSHIVKLQSHIIFHFTGDVLDLQDTRQGRQKLQAAMAGKSCFLYIDNVVDSYYIKELLPREFLQHNPSQEKLEEQEKEKLEEQGKTYYTKKRSAKNLESQVEEKKVRILITSRQNDLKPLLNIKNVVHDVRKLSVDTAEMLLRKTILQGDKPALDFDEEGKINELAGACRSVPLLLSIFGNHLKDNREGGSYEEAIKALNEGNIDKYCNGEEELLSEILMYVFDKMKDKEAQEAFLDICTYFHGWQWNLVAYVMDIATLLTLQNKKLVNKSEAGEVIVHDILRLMGAKRAKDTRLMNHEDFLDIIDDESKLGHVKVMVLKSPTSLVTIETRHLNAMQNSLRVLALGEWVRIDGLPCHKAFKNLRYLEVGDLKDFPFKDVSKMEKLNVFCNSSKPGMELDQLPPNLKHLTHKIPYLDCDEFAKLHLKNLKYLKECIVETKRSVRLPQGFKLPASLELLRLNSCEQLPGTFGHLSALQTLSLDKCDLKCLPQEFAQSVQLKYLSLQHCTNMISLLANNVSSLCSLRDLQLRGCTRLEKLPDDLGTLTALQGLDIRECENLRILPENIGGLKSLKTLALDGCTSLQRLPDSLGMLRIENLTLKYLTSLKELPQSIRDLSFLKSLRLISCHSLEFVPDSLAQLTNLCILEVTHCIKLGALPQSFEQVHFLKRIILSECPLLTGLPDGFQALKTLKRMELVDCISLVNLPPCFEMLSCLKELCLDGLFFSSLPHGLGTLKKLKILSIQFCCKFQTVPQDFENLSISELWLNNCHMLVGTAMDKIVKLQNCHYVCIYKSQKLIERWNELEEENKNLPMIVQTSELLNDVDELDRVRRVGLLRGKCIQLDSTTNELLQHSSLSVPNGTDIAVISLQSAQPQIFRRAVDMVKEGTSNFEEQLRIIYVCRRSEGSGEPTEEEETGKIRQALSMLPHGISYAIPSTDSRRLSLIGQTIFGNSDVFNYGTGIKLLCIKGSVWGIDEGHQILLDDNCFREDGEIEISKNSDEEIELSDEEVEIFYEEDENSENFLEEIEIFEKSDEENKFSDGIVKFINFICENKIQSWSGQCSPLPEENMVGQFIQTLKDNIDHFSGNKVMVDHLQGKTLAIILIDQNDPECIRLQEIYHEIKLKHSNFEAIWIPLQEQEDLGFGTYSRAIQCMPWLTLADPKLIKIDDIKDKRLRVIIIDSGGSIGNPNALSLLMSLGADAYPFTKGSLSQLDFKSCLETLFHSTKIKLSIYKRKFKPT